MTDAYREACHDANSMSFAELQAKYIDYLEIGIDFDELGQLEARGEFPARVHPSGFWLRSEVEIWFGKNPERRPKKFVFKACQNTF